MLISEEKILEIISIFNKIRELSNKNFSLAIKKQDLYSLQIYSTQIGVIPHDNKEKLIKKIALKLKKKIV